MKDKQPICHTRCRDGRTLVARMAITIILAGILPVCAHAAGAADEKTANSSAIHVILDVSDMVGNPGQQNLQIPIFFDNFLDSIAGIEIWLQLDRPDIMLFKTNSQIVIDTTYWDCTSGVYPNCNDSTQVYDTTAGYDWRLIQPKTVEVGSVQVSGSLSQNWEFMTSRSLGGIGADLKIVGLANQAALPNTPSIAPQSGGLLLSVLGDILPLPDTQTARTVNINVIINPLDHFSLADEEGNSIGVTTDSVLDTVFWKCSQYVAGNCVNYYQVPTPPYESLSTRLIPFATLNTSEVIVIPGSVIVNPGPACLCGDADGTGDLNIGDVLYLIGYIFQGGGAPTCGGSPNNWSGDADGTCDVNIGDALFMVAFIFQGGGTPTNCCATGP